MIYRTDYHMHSTFSDGKAAPEAYITAAKSAGMSEIGFSEHLNLFVPGQEWCMDPARTGEYAAYIKNLRKTAGDLKLRTGLEVDYFPGKEKEIYDFIATLPLDYVIGSVHYMGDTTVDSSPDFFSGKDIDELFSTYFDLLFEAVESGLFDIIGHADLVRIYNFKPVGDPEKLYRELARRMAKHDIAFEINTNGRNRVLGDFYPDRRYLGLFRKENVPVCVNSDSHYPERVGQYFDEAYRLLSDAGYTEMCTFKNRERFMVPADFSKINLK
jgi:histidinol-phosphatase (PHP family)